MRSGISHAGLLAAVFATAIGSGTTIPSQQTRVKRTSIIGTGGATGTSMRARNANACAKRQRRNQIAKKSRKVNRRAR